MNSASGQVARLREFAELFTVPIIYSRPERENRGANKSVETNRRLAFPFNTGLQFESASCAPPWEGNRGLGLSEEARQVIRSVRTFTNALSWFGLQPRPGLLSHGEEVCLMASPEGQYAIGFDGFI